MDGNARNHAFDYPDLRQDLHSMMNSLPGDPKSLGKLPEMYPRIRLNQDQQLPVSIIHFLQNAYALRYIEPFSQGPGCMTPVERTFGSALPEHSRSRGKEKERFQSRCQNPPD